MIQVRPARERGHFNHGWLDTWHTFSFADYVDPDHRGFRALRVINEDFVAPGMGFGMHPHRDMEIVTVVLEGQLQHKDSLGHGAVIRPGEVQRISAGTGVLHSEFNPSATEPVHLYQIWLRPDRPGHEPRYEQRDFPPAAPGTLAAVVSPTGAGGTLGIHQDAWLYRGTLEPGQSVSYELRPGRHAWLQTARGALTVNGVPLRAGDGAAVSDETRLALDADAPSEVLLFDLA